MITKEDLHNLKKVMCKTISIVSLVLIEAAVIVMMSDTTAFFIPEIGFYLDGFILKFLFIAFSLVWFAYSPLRRSCYNGGWTEVFHNLIPIEILLFLIFAQWHFLYAVLAVVSFACVEAGFLILLWKKCRDNLKRGEQNIIPISYQVRLERTKKQWRKYRRMFQRFTVLAMTVICAAPCFMATAVYELRPPVYKADRNHNGDDYNDAWLSGFEGYEDRTLEKSAGEYTKEECEKNNR